VSACALGVHCEPERGVPLGLEIDDDAIKAAVINVARGYGTIADLRRAGIPVVLTNHGLTLQAGGPKIPLVSMLDVAHGLLYVSNNEGGDIFGGWSCRDCWKWMTNFIEIREEKSCSTRPGTPPSATRSIHNTWRSQAN
jgi:hypothetical protein